MKDLMKGLKKPMDEGPHEDLATHAKLKVLGHLKSMASGMMGTKVKEGWAKRSDSDPMAAKSNYNMKGMNTVNDGTAASQGLDDHDGDKEASVAEHNSMANDQTSQDMNQEHTPESLDAEIARLHEMKARIASAKPRF